MSKKNKPDPHSPFAALATVKAEMVAEEAAKLEAEKARKEAAKARGELESRRYGPARDTSVALPPRAHARGPSDVWRPNLDEELFRAAMSGVVPLDVKTERVTPGARDEKSARPAAVSQKLRRAAAEGGPKLEHRWLGDGAVQGWRRGHEFALEVLDRFASPSESLDLHGLEPHEAALKVVEFVRSRRARKLRCVAIIHGWGRRSPDGASVLCDAVVKALCEAPAALEVDAFATAPENLGGRGAILVSLRA